MIDYIRREDAIDAFNRIKNTLKNPETAHYDTMMFYEIEDVLEDVEPADVVQVVHARWENYSPITIKCSHCGHVIHDWRYSECKYCPNCGAKRDARGEE